MRIIHTAVRNYQTAGKWSHIREQATAERYEVAKGFYFTAFCIQQNKFRRLETVKNFSRFFGLNTEAHELNIIIHQKRLRVCDVVIILIKI